eukprot:TRINITY_DN189_c0_g2_i3.p1 TRINITY_DN189_c0_g2~~TRINITY_DN189_c0_g2_i3.p1  ORF type:complete len:212 (+),score=31.49 TRINITY_DN189_c0_g2_i3:506-1141(+)
MAPKQTPQKQANTVAATELKEALELLGTSNDYGQSGSRTLSPAQVRLVCANGCRPRDIPIFKSPAEKNAFVNANKLAANSWARKQPPIAKEDGTPVRNPNARLTNGIAWEILAKLGVPEDELPDPMQTGMGDFTTLWEEHGFQGTPWDIAAIHLRYPNITVDDLMAFTKDQANRIYNGIKAAEDEARTSLPGSASGSGGSTPSKRSRSGSD